MYQKTEEMKMSFLGKNGRFLGNTWANELNYRSTYFLY